MQVCRLRLVGFKSFVDATELALEPGLTGIVGPNGCGKSNLVEALRWVMGETSARRLRGGEMDDVIFAGATVSQGRVAALIDAKPAERRLLLEEAAGTAGLHARRRETELKLDAAEENLERLDDVVATIEVQFENLRKQARQAQRYRRFAEQIRRTEAMLFRARWLAAQAEAERSSAEHRATERIVAEATENALAGVQAHDAAEAALPPLRAAEATAAAELQRLTNSRGALEQEL